MPVRPCCASLEPRLLLNGTLTVNSNADNTDSDNTLTLREAILVADGRLGRELTAQELAQVRGGIFAVGQNWFDDIVFANGVGTIRPTSPLPALGSRDDVNGRMPDGTKVVLSGENAGGGASGLVLGDGFGTTNIVVDLVIRNFSSDGLFAEGPVGCLLTGLTVASNGGHGIVLVSGRPLDGIRTHPSNNQIGGGPFTPAAGMRNYVYSNGGDGIRLEKLPSAPSSRPVLPNVFLDNYVGLRDDAGDADFGNAGHGIHFVGASGNAVASNSVSPPRPNVVSGNGGDGIRVEGVGATSNTIQGNFIGTTPSGGAPLGNDGAGVAIVAGAGFANAIGLSNTVSNNVIAANAVGVRIDGVGTNGASLTGNYLGTNRTGAPGLGNRGAGVLITGGAQNVFVGGINTGRNFIAGNAGPGVDVAGAGTDRNNVIGNYVGTVDGRTALPNAVGVRARDGAGAVQVADNRVGGNTGAGIEIIGTAGAESAALLRNAVGLGILTTTSPLPNGGDGIVVGGGARGVALDGNVVAGNLGSGIHLRDAGTDGTVLTNNSIGTGTPGTPLGNAGPGLRINGASNTRTVRLGAISGVNTIVFNGGAGVLVEAGSGNELTNVSVFANGGLGIDLAPGGVTGVTPNDGPGDADEGPNGLQNAPVLLSADPSRVDDSETVTGYLAGKPNTQYGLTFFGNDLGPGVDPSGYGEGQRRLATRSVRTDAAGYADISFSFLVPAGMFVTALATDGDGSTSEFSNRINVSRRPFVGQFAAPSVVIGQPLVLAATASDPDAPVVAISFYRETNGSPDLQAGHQPEAGDDLLLGTDADGSDGWSLAVPTDGLVPNTVYTYYARSLDAAGTVSATRAATSAALPAPVSVVGRHVFYNGSAFDGNDPAATAADDGAVATDKAALLPGQTPTFANVTSYTKGINGVMVDLANLPDGAGPTAADFVFRFGSLPQPNAFQPGSAPVSVTVRRGAGVGGSDRVTIVWKDYNPLSSDGPQAVGDRWLEVRVRPTGYTGLTAEDLFMFGNRAGETGDGGGGDAAFRVSALDVAAVKRALGWATPVTSAADFNRDGRTNALDLALVRRTLGHSLDTSGPGAGTLLTRRDGESDGVGEGVLSIC